MLAHEHTDAARLPKIKEVKARLEQAKHELDVALHQSAFEGASWLRFVTIPEPEKQLPKEGERAAAEDGDGNPRVLVNMADALKQRVVGQNHAVTVVSDAVRILRAGLQAPNRPVASFLFLGSTSIGKTELCKALAGFLFKDEQRGPVTIGRSEYHDRHTIAQLIGAVPGYAGFEEGGQLMESVRRRPYAVELLDELEKAYSDVVLLSLQILDEDTITDSQGRKVDLRNTIVCLTSNLGSDVLARPGAPQSTSSPSS